MVAGKWGYLLLGMVVMAGCAPTPVFISRSDFLTPISGGSAKVDDEGPVLEFASLGQVGFSSDIEVHYRLIGTSAYSGYSLPTRTITVGPDVLAGALLRSDEVIDFDALGALSEVVRLPASGGMVDAFVEVGVEGATDGLFASFLNITADGDSDFVTDLLYDIAFEDAPGRTALYEGMVANIPDERRIAGMYTSDDIGQFVHTFFSPFPAEGGKRRLPEQIFEAGFINNGIEGGDPGQTFGVGMLGQGRSSGPTIVGRFRFLVPQLPSGVSQREILLTVEPVGTICYLEDAHFPDPATGPLDIARPVVVSVEVLTIVQGR